MRAVSKRNFNSGKYGTSSREGLALSLFFGFLWGCVSFGLSLAFPFCLLCDGSSHRYFIEFLSPLKNIYMENSYGLKGKGVDLSQGPLKEREMLCKSMV
jgi:hypothetical protein